MVYTIIIISYKLTFYNIKARLNENQKDTKIHYLSPSPTRTKIFSKSTKTLRISSISSYHHR